MNGIELLKKIRLAGYKPHTVTINFDSYLPPKYQSELTHLQLGYASCKDLRPFLRMDVQLIGGKYSEAMGALYENLKPYASSISVMVAEFGDDLGWWWSKETGRREF